jgi:large subunit ribosomal protein L6
MIKWKEVDKIKIPEKMEVSLNNGVLTIKGKLGAVSRNLFDNYLRIAIKEGHIVIEKSKENRYTRAIAGTWMSEIRNQFKGVTEGFTYTMKVDYTHFPTRVSVRGTILLVENFLGERSPREAKILGHTKISIKGDKITLTGIDKREIGETCSNIERATKIRGFDLRVFQDGIFPVETEEVEDQ